METLKLKDFIKIASEDTKIKIIKVCWDNNTNTVYSEEAFIGLANEIKNKNLLDLKISHLQIFCWECWIWVDGFGW